MTSPDPRPLNDAWAEANAVLPGVFWVESVTHVARMEPPNSHVARAVNSGPLSVDRYGGAVSAYGDDPEDALRNLTRRLLAIRDGEEAPRD